MNDFDRISNASHSLNRDSYDAIARDWDAARVRFYGRESDYLDALLQGLEGTRRILDLGCGTGRPFAERLLSLGHQVTGVDQSEGMLMRARARFPHATWIRQPIESYVSDSRFDAIVCWDALFHIERSMHEALLQRWVDVLVAGGRLMFTVGGSDHPAFTDTMLGQRFFYDSHPPAKTMDLVALAGLRPTVAEYMNLPTAGRDKGRYAVVATKAEKPEDDVTNRRGKHKPEGRARVRQLL